MTIKSSTAFGGKIAATVKAHRVIGVVGSGILLTMIPVTLLVTVLKELVSLRFAVSSFWTHLFISTSLIGAILFAPLAGLIIDKNKHRRRLLAGALLGNSACFAAMAMAPTFTLLMIARFIEGAMHITALTAWMATAADLSRKGRSGRMMGAMGGMIILGVTIGVPLGGVIAGDQPERVFWVAAVISLVAIVPVFFLKSIGGAAEQQMTPREFFQLIGQHPWLGIPYLYTFIDRMCIGVVVSTFTLYMTDVLLLTPATRGVQLSYFLLPFAILCYPMGRLSDRWGRLWMMAFGSLAFGLLYMSYGYVEGRSLTIVMVMSGILSALMFAPSLAVCKDLAPEDHHGVAFSGYNIAGSLGFVAGPLLGGSLFVWFSANFSQLEAYRMTFVATGAFEVLCALATLPLLLKLRRSGRSK